MSFLPIMLLFKGFQEHFKPSDAFPFKLRLAVVTVSMSVCSVLTDSEGFFCTVEYCRVQLSAVENV